MAQPICSICRKRRGKRACPSKEDFICAACCAAARGREITCREECAYLRQSRRYTRTRTEPVHDAELARRGALIPKLGEPAINLVFELEARIRQIQQAFTDLTDEEVREGAELLRNTFETRDRGIIYDFTSPSPRVQALIRALSELIEEREKAMDAAGNRIYPLKTVIAALGEITNAITHLGNRSKGTNPYLGFVNATAAMFPAA